MSSPAAGAPGHTATPSPGGSHGHGETSGSPQRPPQRVIGNLLRYDLRAEAAALRQEPAWQRGDRNAKTLVKETGFRVVLTTLKSGGRLREHQAPTRLTLHCLEGRLRLHTEVETAELAAGELLAVAGGIEHDVEALEDSTFLLTLAGPDTPG
jgi:quercetin dioxygenase-like cupin family protein